MVTLPGRPAPVLLELDLTSIPLEAEPDDLVGKLRSRHRPRMRAVLRALHEAGDDTRVRGLVVKLGGGLPHAVAQELAAAVGVFRRSGKPVTAWAESFGEAGSGTADYVLAAACSEVWLQPTGQLALTGVAAEVTFLRGVLDKLGVVPELGQRHEYKSAADRIMQTGFTAAHHESVERLTGSVWDSAVGAIAAGRGLDADRVRALADTAPLSAQEAHDGGLVDRLGYRDEVYAAARTAAGDGVQLLFADQWRPRTTAAQVLRRDRDVVALVEGRGEIVPGRGRPGPRGPQLGSDGVAAALRAAREDEHVRAVVFRVDSPGGSAVASDTIWREVVLTRQAGKPVIVSMGAVAGSGGYYIACPADAILAQPATLTGSIGVVGGKVSGAALLERLGVGTGAVEHGAHSRMYSPRREFTDDERARMAESLDRIYADFVQKVADGRGMTWDAVHEVARGRVWTGADALERGLVDSFGGLRDAVALARTKAGLREDAPVRAALHVPALAKLGRPRSSEDPRARTSGSALAATSAVSPWGEWAGLAAALGLPAGGALRMPDVRLH